jgi:hypothetical protein
MKRGDDGIRLRIFIDESLRYDHKPLYEYLVERARRDGLAGATVFRGMEGMEHVAASIPRGWSMSRSICRSLWNSSTVPTRFADFWPRSMAS